ncbi:MAG TPA: hypothetical protein VEB20_08360 [Azospirillaceae bacterium]|nr:hypothetical protein [Azospirillaceae bacterium]
MSQYRTQNRVVLAKVETSSGTDASPAVGSDAFKCIGPAWSGGPESIANDQEVTGALDTGGPIVGGGGASFSAQVNVKGPGTAGEAPEFGALLRSAGLAQTLTAADVTGTAQAGGAATITLASGASAVNDAYAGMVIETTAGTGSGQTRVIHDYVGGTKVASVFPDWSTQPDATTTYAIRANALYVPASTSLKTVSLYDYMRRSDGGNARLRKLLGAASSMTATLPVRGIPTFDFQLQGKFVTPTDVSDPGNPTLDTTVARPVMAVDCSLGGTATKFNQVTFDLGNQVAQADDPSDDYGIDVAGIVRRTITGRINPPLDLLSVRNVWQDFLDGTERKLWISWGSVAGNRVSILFPRVRFTGQENEDVNGFGHEGIPFAALGEDSGIYICFW